MKTCPQCKNVINNDNADFCPNCGMQFAPDPMGGNGYNMPPQGNMGYNNMPPQGMGMAYDNFDHTAEFDPKDISDNKVIAMLVYLLGIIGIFMALIGSNTSPYAGFHVRQALKFVVCESILAICTMLLFWTIIVPIAAAIAYIVLAVVKIICFFQICAGKAKEPAIIRSLGFLK